MVAIGLKLFMEMKCELMVRFTPRLLCMCRAYNLRSSQLSSRSFQKLQGQFESAEVTSDKTRRDEPSRKETSRRHKMEKAAGLFPTSRAATVVVVVAAAAAELVV